MKTFKHLILALLAFAFSATAQFYSGSLTNGVNLVNSGGTSLGYLQLIDTSGTNQTIVVYDNDSSTSTNRIRPAYTATTQYTTNIVRVFTNFAGVLQTNTTAQIAWATSTVAATTNEAARVITLAVPANSSTTFAPTQPLGMTWGFQIKTTGTAAYNATYAPLP
jgi:hypothetical protein